MSTRLADYRNGLLALLVMLVPLVLMVIRHWHDIPLDANGRAFGVADPDPWLRLTLVREWLSGGSWFDHSVARTNAPFGGIVSPWTRPLDVVIAAFTQLQPYSVALDIRLARTALMLPVLWAALMMLGVYRAVWAFAPMRTVLWMANALALTGLSMWAFFVAGYADHHAPLAVLLVWVVGGLLRGDKFSLGFSGVLLGLMLWMSPEALILIGAIYAWLGLAWLRGAPLAAKQLLLVSGYAALTTIAALLIERPEAQWFTPVYDSISIVHAWLMAGCALIALLMVTIEGDALQPLTFRWRWRIAAVSVAFLLKLLHHYYPLFFAGPMVGVDPYITNHFLKIITEAQPVTSHHWLFIAAMLAQPLMALCVTLRATRGGSVIPQKQARLLAFLLAFTLLLYAVEQRWYYYFYPLVVITLAPWLAALMNPTHPLTTGRAPARWLEALTPNQQALRRMPVVLALLAAQGLLLLAAPDETTPRSRNINTCHAKARSLIYSGALNDLGGGKPLTVFTSTDLGGEILFWTPHRIIASNYHREGPGIRYVWEADAITDAQALRRYLAQRHVDALLICPVVRAPEASVLQGLQQSKPTPAWLKRVAVTIPLKPDTDAKPTPDDMPDSTSNPAVFLVVGHRT
ncbi:MAG: hypothetical protein ACKVOE_02220 [Rickettsiales bacterium]